MDFATETQTGPSRWTTDDVDVVAPTTPELQHLTRTWPLPVTLFAVAIVSVIIGMNWWDAKRKRKLKEWRVARWERRKWGVPVDDERPLSISVPYWRKKRWEEELERRAELKRQAEKEAEEAEERRMKPRFISKAPWAQTKEDKEYLAWKAEKERQKKEKEALETAQTNAQLNAQRSLEIIRQATPIRVTTQERVPIVQIISPRPTTDAVTEPTNEKADGEEERPALVRIASRARPPPAKSALRKNTSRKRPVIDVDADVDDNAGDRQAKKQKPNTPEADADAVTPTTTETPETVDEDVYEEPQMPGAFEVVAPKLKPTTEPAPTPQPAPQPAQASRKRPATDDLEQDQVSQRKRTKKGKAAPAAPTSQEVTAVESWVIPDELRPFAPPRGTKRARSDVGSEFGDKLRVKKKGKRVEEIVDVEMEDQDEPQSQPQQLVVSNGARKSKRVSVTNGRRKPVVLEDEDEDEDAVVSTDPLCQGRKIGAEWEIGNRRFKVGPDGRRLRLVPLRTKRKKYEMPIDSVHPDATAVIEVLVDTWLTEEEYKLAREQGNLGWQIITPSTPERKPGSRRSSMSCSVREDELPGKENKLPFPSCSPNEPGSGGDSPGKPLMWNSGRIRGVSNTSLPTSPNPIMRSIPTTPGRTNHLSLEPPTKPITPARQTTVSLSSGGGNASTPARNGGTVITVRQITTTPGGGMPSWSGMQKGRTSWARPAGANGIPGRHMLSMLEKREAEARALEKLKARVTDSKAAASTVSRGLCGTAATRMALPAITVTSIEPAKPSTSVITPTTTSLFAPPAAPQVDAQRPSLGLFGNPPGAAPSTTATAITTAPSLSSTLAPPRSVGLGLAPPSTSASATAPALAPAISITGEMPSAPTTTAAPSLLSRHGAAPAAPAPAERKEPVAKPPLFSGLTGFGAPSAPQPILSTLNFGAPTTTIATTIAPPTIPNPAFNPTPAPAHISQPPKPASPFPTMGFNVQQPAAVPPAMESKDKEPPKAPSLFGAFPTPTFSNTTTMVPATSAVNTPGLFGGFGKPGATAAASMPSFVTSTAPNGRSLFGNHKAPQAPGTTATPTTGPLFGAPSAPTEVPKPAGGGFLGAFNKPTIPAPSLAANTMGFSSFSGFGAPKPAPEPEMETQPSQPSQPPASGSLFSRLGPQSSQPTMSSLFGAPPAAPVFATATAPTRPAEPPQPAFSGISLPPPKPTPTFSSDGPFGKHVLAFHAARNPSGPAPASESSTPPTGDGKEVPALANAATATEGSAPPGLFGGFSIKGAALSSAAPAPMSTAAEPPKRRNGGFFGPSANAATFASPSTETQTAVAPPRRNGGFFGPSANASSAAASSATTEQPNHSGLFGGPSALGAGSTFGTGLNGAGSSSGATTPGAGGFSGFSAGMSRVPKFGPPTFKGPSLTEKKGGNKPAVPAFGFAGFSTGTSSSGTAATSAPVFDAFTFQQTSNSSPTAVSFGEQKPEGSAALPRRAYDFGGRLLSTSNTPATGGTNIPSTFGPFSFGGTQKTSES